TTAIEGSAAAVARLREAGERTVFLTNNAEPTMAQLLDRLAAVGIDAMAEDLLTSPMAAATLLESGTQVLLVAGPGVAEAVVAAGATITEDPDRAEVVIVGRTKAFDFDLLALASRALHHGARLVATNADPTYPTPEGLEPGNGALVAAVAAAGLVEAVIAGKPHEPMANLVRGRVADVEVIVGDQPLTDGLLAERLGVDFALVLSGITTDAEGVVPVPATVGRDLAAVVASRLS
ncbi:MAG TPA: HAD hydrolase-like protein, partial [Acidimicrobiales bacterium]|nr:HAD hydrolase-like protein [Acidimicrobiales bacterium]